MDFKLAELRKRRGITQKELAETLLVSPQTISKWENGIAAPDIAILCSLTRIFNVSLDGNACSIDGIFWSDNRYVIGNCAVGYQL